jgi:hypothetical protein
VVLNNKIRQIRLNMKNIPSKVISYVKQNRIQSIAAGVAILVIAGVGYVTLIASHAQSPYASIDAANGRVAGSAGIDGRGVQFRRHTPSPSPSPSASVSPSPSPSASPSPAPTGSVTGVPAGISTGYTFEVNFNSESAADQSATISEMVSEGVKWLRVETYPGYFTDPLIKAAVAAGINVDVIIQWSSTTDHTAATYATWAGQAVTHLKAEGVNTFELLNETNGVEDPLGPDAYTALLKATYPVIKADDSNAFVITAGLAPNAVGNTSCTSSSSTNENMNGVQYLQCMYEDGAEGYFNAVGYHPYDANVPPADLEPYSAWSEIASVVSGSGLNTDIRALMVQYGDTNKQIWATEWGCPTDASNQGDAAPFCPDSTMQTLIPEAFSFMRAQTYYGPLFFYDWIDDSVNEDGDFGLCKANAGGTTTNCATPKPDAYAAYKAAAAE